MRRLHLIPRLRADRTPPVLHEVVINSTNVNPRVANNDDTVSLHVRANEQLSRLEATLNNRPFEGSFDRAPANMVESMICQSASGPLVHFEQDMTDRRDGRMHGDVIGKNLELNRDHFGGFYNQVGETLLSGLPTRLSTFPDMYNGGMRGACVLDESGLRHLPSVNADGRVFAKAEGPGLKGRDPGPTTPTPRCRSINEMSREFSTVHEYTDDVGVHRFDFYDLTDLWWGEAAGGFAYTRQLVRTCTGELRHCRRLCGMRC